MSRPVGGGAGPLTLEGAAALAGEHCWVERRLFELLGRWSALTGHAPATLALDRHAQHAAWRAEQWWDRLPVLAQVDRNALVAPRRSWRALLVDLGPDVAPAGAGRSSPGDEGNAGARPTPVPRAADPTGVDSGIGRMAVVYRVLLPRLVVDYGRHAVLTTAVADGPVIRTLGHVRSDVMADWADGAAVLQGLLTTGAAVDDAAAAVVAAERRLLG